MNHRTILLPGPWSIPEFEDGRPRRLQASLLLGAYSFLSLRLRRRKGGGTPAEIYRHPEFLEAIDTRLNELLAPLLGNGPDVSGIAAAARSFGFFDDGRRSPTLTYRLDETLARRLANLSAHQAMTLLDTSPR